MTTRRIRITNLNNTVDHLSKAITEANIAMQELNAAMVEYRIKKPGVVKTNNIDKDFAKMKEIFLSYYKREKTIEYYWQAIDAVHLNKIIRALRLVNNDLDITPAFELLLSKLEKINPWIYSNLSIAMISVKINNLICSMVEGNEYKQELLDRLSNGER